MQSEQVDRKPLFFRHPEMNSVTDILPEPITPKPSTLYKGWVDDGTPKETDRWTLSRKWLEPFAVVEIEDDRVCVGEGFAVDLDSGDEYKLTQGTPAKPIESTAHQYGNLVAVNLTRLQENFVIDIRSKRIVLWAESSRIAKSVAKALNDGNYQHDERLSPLYEYTEGRCGDYSFTEDGMYLRLRAPSLILGLVASAYTGRGGNGFSRLGRLDPFPAVRIALALKRSGYNELKATSKAPRVLSQTEVWQESSREFLKKVDQQIAAMEHH